MSFIVNSSLSTIEEFEATCQRFMIMTIPRYCAERWADIMVSDKLSKYSFYFDKRVEPVILKSEVDKAIPVLDAAKDEWITLKEKLASEEAAEPIKLNGLPSK